MSLPAHPGCVVYEMIVGFSPFRSEKIYEWSGLTKKDKVRRTYLPT